MLKLSEWKEIREYAINICNELGKAGLMVDSKAYQTYNGRKGIQINVYDDFDKIYGYYCSGIYDTVIEYKLALNRIKRNMLKELL